MKDTILILVFHLFLISSVACQSINIGIGTKWIYRAISMNSQKYLIYEIQKDTTIDNNDLYILEKGEVEFIGTPDSLVQQAYKFLNSYYLRLQNNNLDVYHENDFVHLFPLYPEINQEWEVKSIKENPCENTINMIDVISVINVESISINGNIIEKLVLSDNGNWGYSNTFYSGIGPVNDIFPVPSFLCEGIDITQGYGEQIICVSDNNIQLTFIDTNDDICSLMLSNDSVLAQNDTKQKSLSIYPNPNQGLLYLKTKIHTYEIITLSGEIVKAQSLSSKDFVNRIDISNLETGIYIIRAFTKENQLLTNKIMLYNEN